MEGDAGSGRLTPTQDPDEAAPSEAEESVNQAPVDEIENAYWQQPSGSRLNGAVTLMVCAVLVIASLLVATGGYFALRAHQKSVATAQAETVALTAAKDCVTATQAPDAAAMAASQQKIMDCSTGDFATQATFMSGLLVDAYEAAKVQLKVSNIRAAVERHNDDGSMDILVAVRVQMSNIEAQGKELGYRLRVRMMPEGGTFKIAKLDQVSKGPGDGDRPQS